MTIDPSHSPDRVRVALDTAFLALPPSGIGSYVTGLFDALAARDDVSIARLTPPTGLQRLGPRATRMAWDAAGVEVVRMATARGSDLLHIPNLSAPVLTATPLIVTIHDVIPLVLPEYRATGAMRLYLHLMTRTVRRARLVLTPSAFSAAEIARVLGIPRERIRVTPLAVGGTFRPAKDCTAVRDALRVKFGIPERYLLHMAGFDRRKNVPLLIRAFARAMSALPNDVVLVLAGAPHSENPTIFPAVGPIIRELGLEHRVIVTGRVDNHDRLRLYQGAMGYVTPSGYEGFGLTPLEAMACGVPVIATDRTSLPEVVGDAAILVQPEIESIAAAIVRLVSEDAVRTEFGRRSLARAAIFSWERTAELTASAYREALGVQNGRADSEQRRVAG